MSDKERKSDESAEDFESLAEHRFRMRHDWDNLIEDLIQDGKELGVFDDLPGKGKPLKLNQSPYGKERHLAHELMKQNDLTPAWIMSRNVIRAEIDKLRADIERTWARHEREFRIIQDRRHRDSLTISWDDACQRWTAQIVQLNKQISDYNLKRPIANMELVKLDLDWELKRAGAPRWLK